MARAVRYARYGGPDVLTLDEVADPEPGPGQVRVRVRAAGVNPIDWKIRSGAFSADPDQPPQRPQGTGLDLAGTVEAAGPGVTAWSPGQHVFGQARGGAAATRALAPADALAAKPDWLSFELAAGLPAPAEAAYRTLGLVGIGPDDGPGSTVLVHAVAGGVGLIAAQLARARGAAVLGTASTRHHAFLRELGVEPVTYGTGLEERLRAAAPNGVDAVVDASGRGVLAVSVELAGSADRVVTIADPAAAEHGVRFSGGGHDSAPLDEVFAEVLPLIEQGRLHLPVEHTFPLEETARAQRLSEEGHLRGKIVITVGD
ncbi:NADP-dependent oxidoreductase [Streptomonospora wellingtoniae]|uniref:NADP-dependent oxidoreductase n=1 Tax=Streptomonospora wellingtoniae TaxID=3075544 RepID=A0ABU2KTL9_9ACTN|nr:NADP-dependent oxidoreductase [Streptomonospora sp. DSM 45055]MDT0302642.1 NADP-dependent oxidoreductase [Streptomonospora sp. DSM 45055]